MATSDSQLTLKMCQLTCRCFLLRSMADNCSARCEQKLTTCRLITCWLPMRQANRNGQVTYDMYCMYGVLARLCFFLLELVNHPRDFCVVQPLLIAVISPFTAGGRKKYNREHLLSFRFLKECMEPPEGLFLPGAIGLVRKTGGDAMGPMSGGFPRDQREDRHTGRDKRVCCVFVHTCTYMLTCLPVCMPAQAFIHVNMLVCLMHKCLCVYHQSDMFLSAEPLPQWRWCSNAKA